MKRELTLRQEQFLTYLKSKVTQGGRLPSLRTAARDMGVSHSAIAQSLKILEEKGYVKREGRYSRTVYLLNHALGTTASTRWREIPIVGRVTAGLPMYAQQEWAGSVVLDGDVYPDRTLFALRINGDSMKDAGILDGDLAICRPRQYAHNSEIVVALISNEDATVKRFFLHDDHIELRPENERYRSMRYGFDEVLVQGKVIGIQRGPEGII
jgi:repressor LexA